MINSLAVLGAGILWFGWFGFNGVSALSASKIAVLALINSQISSSLAMLIWIIIEWSRVGKPTTLGAITGAIAGLAAITPAAGFVGPLGAAIIGIISGLVCYLAVLAKERFGYDDSLDVFGVHGIGGLWGTIAVGIFASKSWNPDGVNGMLSGDLHQLGIQCLGAVITIVFSMIVSFVILKVVDLIIGLRVEEEDEDQGLDITQHSESAYI